MADQLFSIEDLREILITRAGVPEEIISDDLDVTFDELGLDSLAFVEIQLAVEQRFDVVVSEEAAREITTLRSAIDYVNRRLRAAITG